jgi:hypothetical protein
VDGISGIVAYESTEMDAWLDKLKAQEKALREINRRQFQEIGRLEKENRGLGRQPQILGLCSVCGNVCI